jgi:hypothetical protein
MQSKRKPNIKQIIDSLEESLSGTGFQVMCDYGNYIDEDGDYDVDRGKYNKTLEHNIKYIEICDKTKECNPYVDWPPNIFTVKELYEYAILDSRCLHTNPKYKKISDSIIKACHSLMGKHLLIERDDSDKISSYTYDMFNAFQEDF